MSFPNLSDILATTIESRTRKVADNVTNNNAVLKKMSMRGRIKTFSGGHKILQELSFAENTNAGWYSGYDILPVGISDVISAAEFDIKQAAVPVVISGLEQLQNSSKEAMIGLMDSRLEVAESTMANLLAEGVYSDGTGNGGKQVDGLDAAVADILPAGWAGAPSYGGIDPSDGNWTFWRNYYSTNGGAAITAANINEVFNDIWANLVRGMDRPDLILLDNELWKVYQASLQQLQRFSSADTGEFGFPTVKFMDADVCLDGGIYSQPATSPNFGGSARVGVPAKTGFFLNTNFLHYRPHAARNIVPLSPNRRYATNQDAEVQIIGWAGNVTTSGRQFQGRVHDVN